MPADPSILGENWSRDVKFPTREREGTPQEGLLSALTQVAPERFPKIAIVEDTTEARRLIRRILQSQGNFTILEASNGREGLEMIQRELPDLVILDLMMPEMDGFTVIEALRSKQETATIPVIVATAKN
ncbi:MAG: response regulator [Anaerolineales bacterium]|uniref:response regulator n=1 Tax=Candidatus Villigracilis proximus TaxID=3140683 RepID=UPI003136DA4D|nr:response regulator [Anaerolineales bacterium]